MAGKPVGTMFAEMDIDLTPMERKLKTAHDKTVEGAQKFEQTFKQLGIQSDRMFESQKQMAVASYDAIKNHASSTANDILRAEEAKNAKLKSLNEQQFGHQTTILETVKKNWFAFTAAIGAAYAAMSAGKEFIDAALAMERINSTLKATMGSGEAAAREFAFISEESKRLGLNLDGTALAFAKFAASTKNTSIEGEETRKIFVGVSEAVTALKLPSEAANGIFLALSQMMSKGKISAEELSGQLGERLPGAVKLTADAMGMTTQELLKNMQAGKLMSSDVLPALAEQLHKTYGEAALEAAQGGQAAINRFNNSMFETKAAIGAALMPALADALTAFSGIGAGIQRVVMNTQLSFVEMFEFVDKVIATVKMIGSALTLDGTAAETFANRMNAIRTAADEQKKHITSMYEKTTDSAYTASEKQKQYIENLARKQKEASTTATKDAENAEKEREKLARDLYVYEAKQFEETQLANEKYLEQMKKDNEAATKAKIKEIEAQGKAIDEMFDNEEKRLKDFAENEAKTVKERGEASRKLYKDLQGFEGEYFDASLELINNQAEQYRILGISEVAVAQWVAQEMMKLEIEKLQASTDWKDGVKAHLLELQQHTTTWGEVSYNTVKAFTENAQSQMSDNLFNVMKGKWDEVGIDWESLCDSMLKAFTDTVSKMVMEAAAKKVVLYFDTVVSEGIGMLFNAASSYLGSGAVDWENLGSFGTGDSFFARGGYVPGSGNGDSVPIMATPGEYVIPKSGVNSETLGVLSYIREWGQLPKGYAEGGVVTPGSYDWFSQMVAGKSTSLGLGSLDEMIARAMQLYAAYDPQAVVPNAMIGGDVEGYNPHQGTNPTAYYQLLGMLNGVPIYGGGSGHDKHPALGLYGYIDQTTGAVEYDFGIKDDPKFNRGEWYDPIFEGMPRYIGTVIGAAAGAAGGWPAVIVAAAMNAMGTAATGGSWQEAVTNAGVGAAAAYFSPGIMGSMANTGDAAAIVADMQGTSAYNAAIAQGASVAEANAAYAAAAQSAYYSTIAQQTVGKYAGKVGKKWATNQIMSTLQDEMGIQFAGMNDNGLFASLASLYGGIGGGNNFGFTLARDGIDYVPRDNFPILAHEGEAVLTKQEASDRRGGGFGEIKIYLDGSEIGGMMKVIADGVVVKRNKSGINSTTRVYR